MEKKININVPSAIATRYGFRGYQQEASRFWMSESFDLDHTSEYNRTDVTKLAATQRAIANFVNIVTGKQIPVVFNKRGDSYTDGNSVVIGTNFDGKNFDPAVGLALHEGSHIAYTDFSIFKSPSGRQVSALSNTKMANIVRMQGLDPDMKMTDRDFGIIKDLFNWIEDRRIDYKIYTNAPGYRVYYEAMYDKYFNDKIIDKALQQNAKINESFDDYLFHIINFTNPNRNLSALTQLRTIWNVIDIRNINRLQTSDDALIIACSVYKIIRDAVQEEVVDPTDNNNQSQPSSSMQPGGGCDAPGDDDSTPGEEDGSEEEDDDFDSEEDDDFDIIDDADFNAAQQANSLLSNREQDRLDKAIEKQKQFLNGEQKKQGSLTKQESAMVEAIKESGTEIVQVPTAPGNLDIVDAVVIKKLNSQIICSLPNLFKSGADSVLNNTAGDYIKTRFETRQRVVFKGIQLGRQLGNKLQLRNQDRTLKTTRLETGKIDRRLVSQLGYENVNVFHKIVTDRYKNYFIHISIDASGSMGGSKFDKALISAIAIAQAASMTTGIRVQISLRGTDVGTFGGNKERCVTVLAYDSATDKMNKIKTYFQFLDTFGCTPEGVSFKSMEKIVKSAAKGDEIIFINYSDGAPTHMSGQHTDPVEHTRTVINDFRANGISVLSYFIYESHIWNDTKRVFTKMYGPDAKFIQPDNMIEIAKTMNSKFLEIAK